MKDYLAFVREKPGDLKQHGILGMKWGRSRSEAQLKAETAKRKASGEPVTPTKKAAAVTPGDHLSKAAHPSGSESSAARYSRLAGEAKRGSASGWDDTDLKFFNARTEALAKVNKLNSTDPSWMSKTMKTVVQASAQKTMQSVADTITNKYITLPITDAIKGVTPEVPKDAPKVSLPKHNPIGFAPPKLRGK